MIDLLRHEPAPTTVRDEICICSLLTVVILLSLCITPQSVLKTVEARNAEDEMSL